MKQCRRWISCLLVCCVVISMLPVVAFAETTEIASGTCGENLTWTLDEAGTLTISGKGDMDNWNDTNTTPWINYLDTIQTVVINDGVTSIGSFAFADCHTLSNVKIPQSVTSFGEVAFLHCFWLNEITIPKAVTHLDVNPFAGCKNLTFIEIESGNENYCTDEFGGVYTKDYSQLIAYPAGRTGSYSVNAKTSTIGSAAFYLCGDLTDITLSENITSIGHDAFAFCGNLENVIIPEKVTNVDDYAFSGCEKLTEVVFKGRAPKFGQDLFSGITTTCFYPIDDPTWTEAVMQDYGGTITWVPYINKHVHEFGDDGKCTCGVTGGVCGDNLTWNYDPDSKTLTISGTGEMWDFEMNETPWYAYSNEIRQLTVEEGVESIGKQALRDCGALTGVLLPRGFLSVGEAAFLGCYSLEEINFPDTLMTLADQAFSQCEKLESIYIPASVTSIGAFPFGLCENLTEIIVDPDNSNYCSEDNRVLFNKDKTVLHQMLCTVSGTYTVPDSVKAIHRLAFAYCRSLTEIIIPDSVAEIGDCAFNYCSSLVFINLPNQVTRLENAVFTYCTALKSITIPASVNYLDNSVFACSDALSEIIFEGSAPAFSERTFAEITATAYYPVDDSTWTSDVMQNYGGTITWLPDGDEHAHNYVDDICTVCGELHPRYISLDSGEWTAKQVVDDRLYQINLNFKDGSLAIGYGVNIEQFDEVSQEAFMKAYYEGDTSVVLKDGIFYYVGSGDGGNITYTTNGKNIYVNCEEYIDLAFVRTGEKQLTLVESNILGNPTGIILMCCEEPSIDNEHTHNYVDDVCTVCGELHPRYISLDSVEWTAKQVMSGTLYQMNLRFADAFLAITYGDNIDQFDAELRETLLQEYYNGSPAVVLVDGAYFYVGRGDGGNITYTTNGKNIYVNCENYIDLTIRRTGEKQLTIIDSNLENLIGLVLTCCGDPAIGHDWQEATCTTPQICSVCGMTEGVATGNHAFDETTHLCACGAYGGKCGDDVTWVLNTEGVLTLSGSGDIYDYSGITNQIYAPWDNWREQISVLVIGEEISGIGNEVFYNMTALREVIIPAGIQSIGARAFAGCCNLKSITVAEENANYTSVDGVLFNKDQSVLISMPGGYSGSYTVPEGVTAIGESAFMYCMSVTDVVFQESLETIGESAFYNCHGLTVLQLPDSISEIGAGAFRYCIYLESINIPESLTKISTGLFSETGIESVALHEGIVEIADAAFWKSNLKDIVIPGSVKKIGNSAFSLCKDLETVVLSEGVEVIGITAFEECTALQNIILPESLKTIEGHAFRYCTSLAAVDIPDAVTSIGYNAFSGCTELSSVTLHEGLQKIEYGAFEGTAVEKITIPATVTCVEWLAFANCEKLTEITFCGNAPFFDTHENEWNMFRDVTATAYYPINDSTWTSDVKQNYGGNITWIAYDPCGNGHSYGADHKCTICGIIGGICGENLIWEFDEETGTLTIKGTGPMYDYADGAVDGKTTPPWADGERDRIKHVVVEKGVTTISDAAFCGFEQIQSVSIANTVESIGGIAFEYCYSLENLVLPDSITSIGVSAFLDCCQLSSVVIGSGVKTIGGYAFGGCSSLKTITFSGNAPSFGDEPNAVFSDVSATARYPAGNPTWTSDVMQDYGGDITWEAYCPGHVFGEWITEGNNSSRICILCGFAEHKVTTDGGDVEIEIPEQPDLEVEVDPVLPSEDNYILVEEALEGKGHQDQAILKVFDINLKNDGVNVQPSGTVKVKLPLDWDKDGNYKVYRVNDDGTLTDMNAYRQGSHMVFETDHFSLYVIVEETEHRHNYKPEVTAPTCTEAGFTIYTCECGDSYVGDEVTALDHNVVLQESEAASCELNGFKYYACERCGGQEYTIILESTGHDYKNGTCSVCGEKDPDYVKPSKPGWGNMWDWIFGGWWGSQEKCDHSYTSAVTAPTCTDKGYTTHTCEKCGDSYKDSYTGAAGHNFENGVCIVCGEHEPYKPTRPSWGNLWDWLFKHR